jgi:type IV secretory pathway protease TraF
MRSERPSITGWLLSRPFVYVAETVRLGSEIVQGKISMPGKAFFLKLGAYGMATALLVSAYWASPIKLMYNHTESEAPGWYLVERISPETASDLELGQMYAVEYQCPLTEAGDCVFKDVKHAPKGLNLLKRVQGLPGHVIQRETIDGVPVNIITGEGYRKNVGEILDALKDGTPIPSLLDASQPITIPEGFVYIGNQRVGNAFDSRYFGLVPISRIEGKARKL